MMNELTVLSPIEHKHVTLDVTKARALMAHQPLVPVVVSEFLKLCIHFPIVIVKHAETGRFGCSALMGLDKAENLFLSEPHWPALYWPAQIRRQPFQVGQGNDGLVVCFTDKHPALSSEQGEPLYQQGKDSACLQLAKEALAELVNNEKATQNFLEKLENLSLLSPMQLEITTADNTPHKLAGLYTIDDRKLNALAAVDLKALQQSGYLSLIYTMIASHGHIYGLVQMKNRRNEKCQAA